jgi:signal transduction histidine kinase
MDDSPETIARDVAAISQMEAVPTLLEVLCAITGMGFAAVARVTEGTWTACAVKDDILFGLAPGGQLDVRSTLCFESRAACKAIAIDHASVDPIYSNHHTPRMYQIESYVSVPIVLANGEYFGNLCAIDRKPAKVSDPKIISMFQSFSKLIALQLDQARSSEIDRIALRSERAASELREQFIAILGHDLRSPIQAIHASGELVERRAVDSTMAGVGARIKSTARRMSALIDDVLDFARIRLGSGIGIEVMPVTDLEPALVRVIEEIQDANQGRTISCEIHITGPVACDVGRTQQLVSNLLSNALTHGSPHTPVEVIASTTPGGLVIAVRNYGPPIPQGSIDKIFQPFWRETTSNDRRGLGLGLHICAQIVRGHGGTLTVSSSQDGGTTFTATLPLPDGGMGAQRAPLQASRPSHSPV